MQKRTLGKVDGEPIHGHCDDSVVVKTPIIHSDCKARHACSMEHWGTPSFATVMGSVATVQANSDQLKLQARLCLQYAALLSGRGSPLGKLMERPSLATVITAWS